MERRKELKLEQEQPPAPEGGIEPEEPPMENIIPGEQEAPIQRRFTTGPIQFTETAMEIESGSNKGYYIFVY